MVDDGSLPPWDGRQGIIALTWHGRQLLGHAALRAHSSRVALVAQHRDGRIIGQAAKNAGFRTIIGSGATTATDATRKGGAAAFRAMLAELKNGSAVMMTADVPKIARVAGAGSVKLAQVSGAPIYCFAAVTNRRFELDNWDKAHIVLPFGRGAILWSKPIHVPRHAEPARLEEIRLEIEHTLNELHQRAADAIAASQT